MPRLVALLAVLALAGPGVLGSAAAQGAPPPTCFGLPATVADRAGEIVGTPGDDVIVGDDARNVVRAGGGNDRVCTNGGNDDIAKPSGPGTLSLDAGPGNDYLLSFAGSGHEVRGGSGDDRLVILGTGTDDAVDGGAGNDYLEGHGGNDTIRGGPGNDALFGGGGADALYGDEGADYLDGGTSTQVVRRLHRHRDGRRHVHATRRAHSDLCQVGPDGETAVNCEREA